MSENEKINREVKVSSGRVFIVPTTIEGYIQDCPILDARTTKRIHMQVVIAWAFYADPKMPDADLTDLLMSIFPESNYANDPAGRAKADRNKFNTGQFRCTGGWHPAGETDARYAKVEETV